MRESYQKIVCRPLNIISELWMQNSELYLYGARINKNRYFSYDK
jgi:hypothetical protein